MTEDFNVVLPFALDYLRRLGLNICVRTRQDPIDAEMDLGLRHMLASPAVSLAGLMPEPRGGRPILYAGTDAFNCRYLMIPLPRDAVLPPDLPSLEAPEETLYLVIGPYLEERANLVDVRNLYHLGEGRTMRMMQYYSTVPVFAGIPVLEQAALSLADAAYGPGGYEVEVLREKPADAAVDVTAPPPEDAEHVRVQLEMRYQKEEEMMNAIARGDDEHAVNILRSSWFSGIDNRASTPLRGRKNQMFVFNTLCRKGAQRGGLHPIFLDNLSRRFSIEIENTTRVSQLEDLSFEMIHEYSRVARQYNTRGYSPSLQKVLGYLSAHMADPQLSLASVSREFAFNKSYLAAMFHRQTGKTMSAYINGMRIQQACTLLQMEPGASVQDIAEAVGIANASYFIRLFRREKGMTPAAYRRQLERSAREP